MPIDLTTLSAGTGIAGTVGQFIQDAQQKKESKQIFGQTTQNLGELGDLINQGSTQSFPSDVPQDKIDFINDHPGTILAQKPDGSYTILSGDQASSDPIASAKAAAEKQGFTLIEPKQVGTGQSITEIAQQAIEGFQGVSDTGQQQFQDFFSSVLGTLGDNATANQQALSQFQGGFVPQVQDFVNQVQQQFGGLQGQLGQGFQNLQQSGNTGVSGLQGSLASGFNQLIGSGQQGAQDLSQNVVGGFGQLGQQIGGGFESLGQQIGGGFRGLSQDVLGGLSERLNRNLGHIDQLGVSGRADIARRFDEAEGVSRQELTNRGLTGTTILSNELGGLAERESGELRRLEEGLTQQRISTDAALSGDIFGAMQQLGLGQLGAQQQIGTQGLGAQQQIGQLGLGAEQQIGQFGLAQEQQNQLAQLFAQQQVGQFGIGLDQQNQLAGLTSQQTLGQNQINAFQQNQGGLLDILQQLGMFGLNTGQQDAANFANAQQTLGGQQVGFNTALNQDFVSQQLGLSQLPFEMQASLTGLQNQNLLAQIPNAGTNPLLQLAGLFGSLVQPDSPDSGGSGGLFGPLLGGLGAGAGAAAATSFAPTIGAAGIAF